jgi:tetraspanin-5
VIFWITGFLLLSVGTWAQIEKNNPYTQLNRLSKFYLDPAWMLIIIGAVTFAIGFSGCVGALRENTCFLAMYSSLLGLLLLAEAVILILAFVSKDWIETELRTRLDDMVILYRDDPDLQTLIDWMQTDWHCCGINKPDDWDMNIYFNSSAKALKSAEAGGVPFSCCVNSLELQNYACGHRVRITEPQHMGNHIYTEGCLPKLQLWLNNNFVYVGTSVFVVAVIQFLGICFAQDLRSDIFAQRAKWARR